jgi:hypothetical protein
MVCPLKESAHATTRSSPSGPPGESRPALPGFAWSGHQIPLSPAGQPFARARPANLKVVGQPLARVINPSAGVMCPPSSRPWPPRPSPSPTRRRFLPWARSWTGRRQACLTCHHAIGEHRKGHREGRHQRAAGAARWPTSSLKRAWPNSPVVGHPFSLGLDPLIPIGWRVVGEFPTLTTTTPARPEDVGWMTFGHQGGDFGPPRREHPVWRSSPKTTPWPTRFRDRARQNLQVVGHSFAAGPDLRAGRCAKPAHARARPAPPSPTRRRFSP